MKSKLILLAVCFVLCFLTITSVSASEIDNTTAINDNPEININQENNFEENTLISTETDLLNDKSEGTFTDLANEISKAGSTLNLNKNYRYADSDSNYKDGIAIDKSITINGNGYTINGNNQARAFNITASNVALNNINFVNNKPSSNSGYTCGGAIYWQGDNGNLFKCNFLNCSVFTNSISSGYIYIAESYGGAIYWEGSKGTLDNCNFVNSSASTKGNNNFREFGFSYGGAVYWKGDDGKLCNSNFCESLALNNKFQTGSVYGGTVYWKGSKGTLSNCSFINSVVSKYGSSDQTGGAIQWDGDNGILSICSFVNCTAGLGGAIQWDGNNGILLTSNFMNCTASTAGAIDWNGDNGFLSGCSFVNCSAEGGGAISWSDGPLMNCSFVNCHAGECGGAVSWYAYNNTMSDCSFVNCSAERGGAIMWPYDIGILIDCSFMNCSADYGGAVQWGGDDGILSNCSFVDCSANYNGGAVIYYGDGNSIVKSSFTNCHAEEYGGGIYFDAKDCSIINSIFESNTAQEGPDWYSTQPTKTPTVISAPTVSTTYGVSKNLVATLNDVDNNLLAGEKISIVLNDVEYTLITNSKGKASLALPKNLAPKTYTATIYYAGNDVYESSKTTAKIVVTKASTVISASDVNIAYKDPNGELVATITNEHGKPLVVNLNINFNGKDYTVRTDSNGQASIATGTLSPGTYTATISYKGSNNYKASSTTAKVIVTKADTIISAPDVTVSYKDSNGALVATIVNEHGKPLAVNLNIKFNGKDYTVRTDSNGQASIPVGNLTPGKYTATISYKGSSNYKASSTTVKVTMTKAGTVISAPNVSVAYKDPNGKLVATITNEHGKPLVVTLNINIDSKDYTVKTDSNGQASIALDTLAPGKYTATISYKGSSNYKASSTTAKVTVTKAGTVISAPNVKIAYKNPRGELVATITNEHGKPLVVSLNINIDGKDYTVKTDSNGQASIALDTLTPGTYTATISYKGSNNYKASSTIAKVTVTKAATIITAPDVTVAYKDTNGKLVPTITNEHGKPLVVNLNVDLNGKTYSVKTDSNGQASVSTANLAPGTYTATISYKGSGNYKASSTTANIQVKK